MSLKRKVVSAEEEFASLRQAWDEIVFSNASNMTIFQSWAYIFNHWKYRKTGNGVSRELHLHVLYDGPTLVAIAPLWLTTIQKAIRIRVLEFIGTRGLDYLGFIISPLIDPREAMSLLLEAIYACSGWDVISLSELKVESANRLRSVLGDQGIPYDSRQCSTCVKIRLPATWEGYCSTIGKSTRRRLAYDGKRLEKLYDIQIDVHQRYDHHFISELQILHEIHQARWRADSKAGVFYSDNDRWMDMDINKELANNGSLRYFVLTAKGKVIAGMACAALGHTLYAHIMSVSIAQEYRRFSPGMVLVQKVAGWAIENGFDLLDLSRGDEPYKFSLGGEAAPNYRITISRNIWTSAMLQLVRAFGKPI